VEAMACQMPVIANPVGGLLEIIEDGQTGYFTKFNDPDSFANLTNRLLEDDILCQRLGCQARKIAEERFSLEKMITEYEAFYLDMLRSR
jgi:glycosyltransferase involved in cell wall biosynthesis